MIILLNSSHIHQYLKYTYLFSYIHLLISKFIHDYNYSINSIDITN